MKSSPAVRDGGIDQTMARWGLRLTQVGQAGALAVAVAAGVMTSFPVGTPDRGYAALATLMLFGVETLIVAGALGLWWWLRRRRVAQGAT